LAVGFDRSVLGDQGARIGAAYNLPSDPTMVPYEYMNGQFKVMRIAVESDLANLNTTRQSLYNSVYGQKGPPGGVPTLGGNTPQSGNAIPLPASTGRINVIRKSDGKPGTILPKDFSPDLYDRP